MRSRSIGLSVLGALGLTALAAGSVSAGFETTTLDNGAALTATITTPVTGDTFLTTGTGVDVPVVGNASIGEGAADVHWTYVIDVSGSAGESCGLAGLSILDCEKQAVINLNNEVVADGSVKDVAVTVFGSTAATADMKPADGDQLLQDDPSSAEFGTVVGSIVIGRVDEYTRKPVGGLTNFAAALNAAINSVTASTASSKNVVFLSDGDDPVADPAAFNTALASMDAAGATIYSFAVGQGAACSVAGDERLSRLQRMADQTGGTCTRVANPADLPAIVVNVTATQMTAVSLEVDGASVGFDTNSNPPPFDGPDSTDVTATAANQVPGAHTVCLTAEGLGPKSDPESADTATQCETYNVYGFDLDPDTATNELSEDDEHTVTATVSGEDGTLDGFDVDFEVTSGPNAGESGSGTTDANGEVNFTYTNSNVDPSGLGTDTIEATVDVNGDTATLTVTKDWVDTIAPEATCVESVNPSGERIPQAPGNGGQGQNQDGFYQISASDNLWPADSLQVFVTDTGSGTVFGPYDVGTNIKYTEASSTPNEKSIGGPNSAVGVHITGNGDAEVHAVDGSGNVSNTASCLVPPKPK